MSATRKNKSSRRHGVTINGQRLKVATIEQIVETIFPKHPQLTENDREIYDLNGAISEKLDKAISIGYLVWEHSEDDGYGPAMGVVCDLLREVREAHVDLMSKQQTSLRRREEVQ